MEEATESEGWLYPSGRGPCVRNTPNRPPHKRNDRAKFSHIILHSLVWLKCWTGPYEATFLIFLMKHLDKVDLCQVSDFCINFEFGSLYYSRTYCSHLIVSLFSFSYENKFVKFFKSKPDLPPGMSPEDASQPRQNQGKHGNVECETSGLSKTAKRNMKRKEKRKQHGSDSSMGLLTNAVEHVVIAEGGDSETPACNPAGAADSTSAAATEKAKKIKNLKKKLRQVEELQLKLDSGEIKQATKEQLEKLGRAKALQDELLLLEEDS
uniref:WIBG Mago-binding domain-containing protein n=1 Tax=Esox lucius TaxID=8010 RepID=A0AAY5K588_ESOLU